MWRFMKELVSVYSDWRECLWYEYRVWGWRRKTTSVTSTSAYKETYVVTYSITIFGYNLVIIYFYPSICVPYLRLILSLKCELSFSEVDIKVHFPSYDRVDHLSENNLTVIKWLLCSKSQATHEITNKFLFTIKQACKYLRQYALHNWARSLFRKIFKNILFHHSYQNVPPFWARSLLFCKHSCATWYM